jgi:hypothetical protein
VIPSAAWGSLRQFGRDDRKGFAVERADRRDQSEDEMYCGECPDTDQRVFLHKLAIGHLAASKRQYQGMLLVGALAGVIGGGSTIAVASLAPPRQSTGRF